MDNSVEGEIFISDCIPLFHQVSQVLTKLNADNFSEEARLGFVTTSKRLKFWEVLIVIRSFHSRR